MELPLLAAGSTVCIVGAGSVGLYAAKECIAAGWVPTVFESSSGVGGVWQSGKHWESLTTNSSFLMMTLGDFEFPFQPSAIFPTRAEIVQYVEAYATEFELWPHVRLETSVVTVEPITPRNPSSAWNVRTSDNAHHVFDAVFCCNGQYSVPRLPRLKGRDGWTGRLSHSHQFGSGEFCRNKRVLVIGIGNSALDVALECIEHGAEQVVLTARRGAHLLPVATPDGQPRDVKLLTRLMQYVLPTSAREYLFYAPITPTTNAFVNAGMLPPDTGVPEGSHQRISNLKKPALWLKLLTDPTVALSIRAAGVKSVGPGKTVWFTDGSKMEVDEMVACTGYHLSYNFLPIDLIKHTFLEYQVPAQDSNDPQANPTVRHMSLYNRVMHPEYPTLNFFAQLSTIGNEAAVGEMQARWVVSMPVSYTHLRAHETPEHLVCRLLLEKKKKRNN
eukprot:TRINITY_DN18677_c0_g1_i5.p1 TRINITY_DN18677_c0_g1~~TRINITY_DN18677_c0_g1_i5.p1  ORF type:complete len:444 (+),score=58.35 TRINITY_DN18677_c0_g1_i5:230-1561(+)